MTLSGICFVITDLATGRLAAQAMICAEARYVSVLWVGQSRIERKFLSPVQWKEVEHEISVGISPGPIPAGDALAMALTKSPSEVVAQYATVLPIEVKHPLQVSTALDDCFRRFAQTPAL